MKTAVITDEVSQNLDVVLRFARDFKLDGIELRSLWNKPPHELSEEEVSLLDNRCRDAGLKVCGIASPVFKCDIENAEEIENHSRIFRTTLELAKRLESPLIRVFTGWRRTNSRELHSRAAAAFREKLIPMTEGTGIILGVENEYSTNVADGGESAAFMQTLGPAPVRIVWDPCNILYMPSFSDPFDIHYPKVRGLVGHYHVKDALRREGEDPPAEAVPLGDGAARLKDTLRALQADGYDGWVSLETHWRMEQKLTEEVTRSPMGAGFSAGAEPASRECMKRLRAWLADG